MIVRVGRKADDEAGGGAFDFGIETVGFVGDRKDEKLHEIDEN